MSKALRHMSKEEREAAIRRRIASNTRGLGYWSAVAALERQQKGATIGTEKKEEK